MNKIASAVRKTSRATGAPVVEGNELELDVSDFSKMEIEDVKSALEFHIEKAGTLKGVKSFEVFSDKKIVSVTFKEEKKVSAKKPVAKKVAKTSSVAKVESESESEEETPFNPELAKASDAKKCGLILPVDQFQVMLNLGDEKADAESAVFLAAVIEYLAAEVLELAGNVCRDKGRKRIIPSDIDTAVRQDEELNILLSGFLDSQPKIELSKKTEDEDFPDPEEKRDDEKTPLVSKSKVYMLFTKGENARSIRIFETHELALRAGIEVFCENKEESDDVIAKEKWDNASRKNIESRLNDAGHFILEKIVEV